MDSGSDPVSKMPHFDGYSISHNKNGTVTFVCSPDKAGIYRITVEYNHNNLIGFPLCFVVKQDDEGYKTAYKSCTDPIADEFTLYCGLSAGEQVEGVTLVNPQPPRSLPGQFALNSGNEGEDTYTKTFEVAGLDTDCPVEGISTLHDDGDEDDASGWLQSADNLPEVHQGQDGLVLGVSEADQADENTSIFVKQEVSPATLPEGSMDSLDTNVNNPEPCQSTLATSNIPDEKNLASGPKHKITGGWIYKCDVLKCNKMFKFEESLRMHRKMYHKNITAKHDIGAQSPGTSDVQHEDKDTHSSDSTINATRHQESIKSKQGKGLQCDDCQRLFSSRYHLQRHSVVHHPARPFTCPTAGCGRKFKLKQSLTKHVKLHSKARQAVGDPSRHFVCGKPHCGRRFKLKQGLAFHLKMHANQNIDVSKRKHFCKTCQKVFPTAYKLRRHSVVHTVDKSYVCNVQNCGLRFSKKAVLTQHIQLHSDDAGLNEDSNTKEKPFICDQPHCGSQFDLQEALTNHQEWHESFKNGLESTRFQCDICQREFFNAYELQRHSTVHSTERKFVCEIPGCGKSYKMKQALARHALAHSKSNTAKQRLKPFVCEVASCGRRFKLEDSLIYHSKMHNVSAQEEHKALICEVCNKIFPTAYKLERHKRVHSLQRPYVCDILGCGKSFKLKDSLNFHIHLHAKSEKCTICKKFVPNLEEHMLKHYPLVGSCIQCRQVFLDTEVMNQHECSAERPPISINIQHDEGDPQQVNVGKTSFVVDDNSNDSDGSPDTHGARQHDLLQVEDDIPSNEQSSVVTPSGAFPHPGYEQITIFASTSELNAQEDEPNLEEYSFCGVCNMHFYDRNASAAHECPSQVKMEVEQTQITESVQDSLEVCKEEIGCVCPMCSKEFKDNYKLQRHLVVHTGSKLFSCTVEGCSKEYKNSETLKNHQSSAHGQGRYKCMMCDQTFHIESRFQRHVKSHDASKWLTCPVSNCSRKYKGEDALKRHTDAEHKYGEYHCSVCPETFQLKSHLQFHIRTHVSESTWKCLDCNKTFKFEATLNYHRCLGTAANAANKKKKSSSAPLFCPVCDKEFTKPSKLVLHVATHSDTKPFMCELCGKSLKTRDTLKKHRDEMHNEGSTIQGDNGEDIFVTEANTRPYLCTYCRKTFRRREHYRQHVLVHESKTQIPCTHADCTKTFPTHFKLRQHFRSVHVGNGDVHECAVCKKSFKRLNILNAHIRTHQNNTWICSEPDCCAKFSTKNSMQRHVLLKHRDMPAVFQCSVDGCNAKFKVKNDLRQHTLSHTSERKFQCTDCGKAFKTKNTLRMHTAIHSEERQSMCSYCGRCFTRKHRLRAHMAKHVDQTQRLQQQYQQWT